MSESNTLLVVGALYNISPEQAAEYSSFVNFGFVIKPDGCIIGLGTKPPAVINAMNNVIKEVKIGLERMDEQFNLINPNQISIFTYTTENSWVGVVMPTGDPRLTKVNKKLKILQLSANEVLVGMPYNSSVSISKIKKYMGESSCDIKLYGGIDNQNF